MPISVQICLLFANTAPFNHISPHCFSPINRPFCSLVRRSSLSGRYHIRYAATAYALSEDCSGIPMSFTEDDLVARSGAAIIRSSAADHAAVKYISKVRQRPAGSSAPFVTAGRR